MNKRQGYSLTELMTALSVGTVIVGLATGTVHRALLLGSQAESRQAVHLVALRLSENFRRDVYVAEDARILEKAGSPITLLLTTTRERSISYQILGNRLLRQQQIDELLNTEVYDFPAGYTISLTQSAPGNVGLLVSSDPTIPGIPPKTVVHLTPNVGRLLRASMVEEASP